MTKSDLILRDIDVFKNLATEFIITLNSRAQKILEPGAPAVEKRIRALSIFKEFGLKIYAFIAPILPYFTNLKQIFEVLKDKVDEIWFDTLNTKKKNWQSLERASKIHYPSLIPEYGKIFFQRRNKYENQLRKEIEILAEKI